MDLTPAALRETTFRGALRGYNVDDVDEFVERVAVGLGELLEQLRLVSQRAAAAERRTKDTATSEDAMKRTLAHAQKLAETVVAEARQEAARLADDSRQVVRQLRRTANEELAAEHEEAAAARAEADRLRREAEAERSVARAQAEAVRTAARAAVEVDRAAVRAELEAMVAGAAAGIDADLRAEVERLHEVRTALQLDIALLTGWVHEQRGSVREVLVETLAAVDRVAPTAEPPTVADVDPSVRLGDRPTEPAPAAATTPTPPAAPTPASPAAVPSTATSPMPATSPAPTPAATPGPPPAPPVGADFRADPGETATPSTFPELSDEEFLAEMKQTAPEGGDPPPAPADPGPRP